MANTDHDYDDGVANYMENEEEFPPLPITPSKPKSTVTCIIRVSDLERYGRQWNLKLYGIPEAARKNVLDEVIHICQEVLSQEREKLPDVIDVTHRLGTKCPNESRPRVVIIRFVVRRYREAMWKAAKNNPFLQSHHLRFTEDLSKEDRESRQKLWPLINKAREEGKSAYFVGGRAFVEGSEIT
ncbi:uncharacterized protein LOC107689943 [Tachysurus ichikawai]